MRNGESFYYFLKRNLNFNKFYEVLKRKKKRNCICRNLISLMLGVCGVNGVLCRNYVSFKIMLCK